MKNWFIFWIGCIFLTISCSSQKETKRLDEIEAVMNANADSVLNLLAEMPVPTEVENLARYNMLTAWAKYRRYDTDFDIDALEHAYTYLKNSKSNLRKAQIYYLHAAIDDQLRLGDEEQRAMDFFQAAKAVEQTSDHVLAAQIYQRIANAMNTRRMFQEALYWGEKYRNEAAKSGNTLEEVVALLQMAMAHCWHSDSICEANHDLTMGYNESIALSHEALQIAMKANDPDAMMRANDKLSAFHSRKQNTDSALHYAIIADSLIYVVEAQSPQRYKRSHTSLADAYRKVGTKMRAEYEKTHNPALLKQIQDLGEKAMTIVKNDLNSDILLGQKVSTAQLGYLINKNVVKDVDLALYYMQRYNALRDSLDIEKQNAKVLSAPIRIEKQEVEATLDKTRHWLWWTIAIFFIVTLCGSSITVLISRRNRRELIRMQDELNEALLAAQEAKAAPAPVQKTEETTAPIVEVPTSTEQSAVQTVEPSAVSEATETIAAPETQSVTVDYEKPIVIEGQTNESLSVLPIDLLCITSEGNYIKIAYLDHKSTSYATKLLRTTMKQIETQLLPYTDIVRCHRAFLVNLNHVRHVTTSSAGLSLLLDSADIVIPVSRTYLDSIKSALKK